MKVVSFKVEDSDYKKLKKMNKGFGQIFRPLVKRLLSTNKNQGIRGIQLLRQVNSNNIPLDTSNDSNSTGIEDIRKKIDEL